MFYVFKTKILDWDGEPLQAEIQERPVYNPPWELAEPIELPLPKFVFYLHGEVPAPDNYWTGTEFSLYSPRLIKLLEEAQIVFETFPATFIDSRRGEPLELPHRVFHLLERWPALDLERSRIELPEIVTFSVSNERLQEPKFLFRAAEHLTLVLIHQDLRNQMDAAGITGCEYVPVDDYMSGLQAMRRAIQSLDSAG